MERSIIIKFEEGDVYAVPVRIVALDRTKYYAERDGFKEGSSEWVDEYNYSKDDSEVVDWMFNNMDWRDLEPHAEWLASPLVKERDLNNAEISIINKL